MNLTNASPGHSDQIVRKKRSQIVEVWKRLRRNRLAILGLIIITVLALVAIFANVISPYPYAEQNYSETFQLPSWSHPFGTDNYGRDIFSRVIYGSRVSILVGFISLSVGAFVGSVLGAIAGYFGGAVDSIILRASDILMAIPGTVLAISIATTLGPGLVNAIIAVSIGSIPTFTRVVKASTLTVKDQEYVESARAIGANNSRIIRKYIFPNVLAPIIVQATLGVGISIILVAALSFLGLGIQPPTPEWGNMLAAARSYMRNYPHMVIF